MEAGRPYASFAVWTVRIVGLAIAVVLLWWSSQLEREFQVGNAGAFRIDWDRYWLIQAVYVVVGMAFAVAIRFPFPRSRYAWGGILIAGIVILPVVHLWYLFAVTSGPQFLHRAYWFDDVPGAVWSTLAGVAIGAGLGARRPDLTSLPSLPAL